MSVDTACPVCHAAGMCIHKRRLIHAIRPDQYRHPDRGHDCMDPESACLISRPRRLVRRARFEWRYRWRWVVK